MSKTNNAAQSGNQNTGRAIRSFRNQAIRTERDHRNGREFAPLPDWMECMGSDGFERMLIEAGRRLVNA